MSDESGPARVLDGGGVQRRAMAGRGIPLPRAIRNAIHVALRATRSDLAGTIARVLTEEELVAIPSVR